MFFISTLWYEDWTNAGIDELLLRGSDRTPVFTGTSPIGKGEFSFLGPITPGDVCGVWLKERLEDYLWDYDKSEYSAGVITDSSITRMAVLAGKGFSANWVTLFIEPIIKFRGSTEYPNRLWQDFMVADYLKGYIKVAGFGTSLTIGREPIKWGPSPRKSLLISGNAPPFDLVKLSYKNPKLKFTFFGTQLDQLFTADRYLTGHRVEYSLKNSINIGISEVALFGGYDKLLELYYFNPVLLYYPYQWHHNSQVNILFGTDFKWVLSKVILYGELMVDDFPWKQSEAREHPKIGINAGAEWVLGRNYFLMEYSTVSRWTYDHLTPWQRYTYMGYDIGNPYGPDFDEIFVGAEHHLSKRLDLLVDASFLRKGEGTIDETYPDEFPEEYWLTGDISNIYKIQAGVQVHKFITLSCKAGCIIIDDAVHPVFSVFLHSNGKIGL